MKFKSRLIASSAAVALGLSVSVLPYSINSAQTQTQTQTPSTYAFSENNYLRHVYWRPSGLTWQVSQVPLGPLPGITETLGVKVTAIPPAKPRGAFLNLDAFEFCYDTFDISGKCKIQWPKVIKVQDLDKAKEFRAEKAAFFSAEKIIESWCLNREDRQVLQPNFSFQVFKYRFFNNWTEGTEKVLGTEVSNDTWRWLGDYDDIARSCPYSYDLEESQRAKSNEASLRHGVFVPNGKYEIPVTWGRNATAPTFRCFYSTVGNSWNCGVREGFKSAADSGILNVQVQNGELTLWKVKK